MYHVIVMPMVSAELGQFLHGKRASLLMLLNRLYSELESNAERYRSRRDTHDQDLFNYDVYFGEGNDWHTFRSSVDDRQATGYLFVVDVRHMPGKYRFQ